jgi:hypothetical protein
LALGNRVLIEYLEMVVFENFRSNYQTTICNFTSFCLHKLLSNQIVLFHEIPMIGSVIIIGWAANKRGKDNSEILNGRIAKKQNRERIVWKV